MTRSTAQVVTVVLILFCSTIVTPTVAFHHGYSPVRFGRSVDPQSEQPVVSGGSKMIVGNLPYQEQLNQPYVAPQLDEPESISSKLQVVENRISGALVGLQELREDLRRECKNSNERVCLQIRK